MSELTAALAADGVLAEAVAGVVARQPGVARLCGGRSGEVGTYLPGRRIRGVRIASDAIEVHLVARWVPSLPALADDVRAAIGLLAAGRQVAVFVEDVESAVLETASSPPMTSVSVDGNPWTKTMI